MSSAAAAIPAMEGGGPLAAGLRLLAALLAAHRDGHPAESAIPADALRRRDPDAWRALFDTELGAIYRYVHSRLRDPHDAEDVTSQVFEEAWRSAKTFRDQGLPPRAWLFGIARNVVNGHRRRRLRRPPHLAIESVELAAKDGQIRPEYIDLARAIGRLSAAHAEVITLRFVHGLSLQEAARVLDTSVDGVKGRQARALAALRAELDPGEGALAAGG